MNLYRRAVLGIEMVRLGITYHFNQPFLLDHVNFSAEKLETTQDRVLPISGFFYSDRRTPFQALAHFERWPEDLRRWYPLRIDLLFNARHSVASDPQVILFCRFADSTHSRFVFSDRHIPYEFPEKDQEIYIPGAYGGTSEKVRIVHQYLSTRKNKERAYFVSVSGPKYRDVYLWEDLVFQQGELKALPVLR